MYERNRNIVRRQDGQLVNVARMRGQLFVCHDACCCGRTADGFAPVPLAVYQREWEQRRFRNFVHLTVGGCLGPCALANVAMLLWDGQALWFQSLNSEALVVALFDYMQGMLEADTFLPPAEPLASLQFSASAWQGRPDGQPVEDRRRYRPPEEGLDDPDAWSGVSACPLQSSDGPSRHVADMPGVAAMPRKNGELVFEAPWQGRAFGLAVALSEQGLYDWDEFRRRLIDETQASEATGGGAAYYERWLAAFESLLAGKGLVAGDEIEERAFQFEFGERDEVF
jgi:nitrile hydratase accessory protein